MAPRPPDSEDPLEYDPFVEATKARARKREEFSVDIDIDSAEHEKVELDALGEVMPPPEPNLAPPQVDEDYNPFEGSTRVGQVDARALFDEAAGGTSATRKSTLDPADLFGTGDGRSTRVVPKQRDATVVNSQGSSTQVVAPQMSTMVVEAPGPLGEPTMIAKPPSPPLKIDFTEVLGSGGQVAGAQRIGAQSLAAGEFLSRDDKQAQERAEAVPRWDMPSSLDRPDAGQAVRVVERRRGRALLMAFLLLIVPGLIAVGGVFIYYQLHSGSSSKEVEALKKADAIHKKQAEEHEKEMAR